MRLQFVYEEEYDVSRVTGWLEDLVVSEQEEKESEKHEPVTPPRRALERGLEKYEEVSPTDTSFSGASIFDKDHGSPCPEGRFRDDVSVATSLDPDDKIHEHEAFVVKREHFIDNLAPESLNSYDPLSDADDQDYNHHQLQQQEFATTPSPHHTDITLPRLTTILSCLQCTLSSLPCSRTPPHCARCIRNSKSTSSTTNPPCLLLRRRFPEEITPEHYTLPVLFKRVDESEESWAEKMSVKEKLLEEWMEKEERRNWVLPRVESEERGGWKRYRKGCGGKKEGKKGRGWEGEGRVVWWEGRLGEGGVEI
jgi:hypothetical protein